MCFIGKIVIYLFYERFVLYCKSYLFVKIFLILEYSVIELLDKKVIIFLVNGKVCNIICVKDIEIGDLVKFL